MRSKVKVLLLATALVSLGGCTTVQQWLQVSPLPVSSQSTAQRNTLSGGSAVGQLDVGENEIDVRMFDFGV